MSLSDTGSSKTGKSSATIGLKTEKPKHVQADLFSIPIEEYVPPQLQKPIAQEKPILKAESVQEVPKSTLKSSKSGKTEINALRIIALAIALLASFQSCYYSFDWFKALLPIPFAVIMALIIVASAVLLPEFAIMMDKRSRLSGVGIALIALLAISFSMMSTVAGLYNARSESVKTETVVNADNDKNIRLLDDAKAESARLTKEIERLNREIDLNLAKSANPLMSKAQINTADYYVQKGKKDRADYESKLAISNKEVARLNDVTIITKVDREDFYTFIALLFGFNSEVVEFLFAAFPSIFLDIIAPVMLGVALFLKDDDKV